MKNGSIAYASELFMRGIISGTFLSVTLGYVYGDGAATLFTGLGICILASFVFAFVRSRTSKFGLFFLQHILFSVAAVALIPEVSAKIICAVVLAVLIGDSVVQLKKPFAEGNRLHFGMAIIFIIGSYAAGYNHMAFLEYSCFILTALFMTLYFIRTGFYNTQQFIDHNDNGKGAPLKDIKLRSYSLVGGFAVIAGVFMVAVRYMGGELIIKHIADAIYAVASAFAKWIVYNLQGEQAVGTETAQDDMFSFVKEAFEERNVPAFIEIIEKIIRYFFIAAIIIGAIALVVWLVFKLYSIFGEKRNGKKNTTSEFIRPVKADKIVRARMEKKNTMPSQNKARRYYKKYVLKHLANKDLPQSKTPFEISKHLGITQNHLDGEIRRIYEKARYSNEECTKEEIKALKEYIKGRAK